MIKLTNQKQILDEMDKEDRRRKTYVMFTSLAYPTVWLWLFVAASYKLANFGHPLWVSWFCLLRCLASPATSCWRRAP